MARRLELHEKLCSILGTRNVYFQPPESVKMKYDAIVYNIAYRDDLKADDIRYHKFTRYEVTYIHRDPDSVIAETIIDSFQYASHVRSFTKDNLYHDVYNIFY